MAEILPIRRKAPFNQSINQSIVSALRWVVLERKGHLSVTNIIWTILPMSQIDHVDNSVTNYLIWLFFSLTKNRNAIDYHASIYLARREGFMILNIKFQIEIENFE